MATPTIPAFEPPDTITALPARGFEFGPAASAAASQILAAEPGLVFQRLLRDQESEAVLLTARTVIGAVLDRCGVIPAGLSETSGPDQIADWLAARRDELAGGLAALAQGPADTRDMVLRQRAPLGLLGGCWLDVLSQPATQPSVIVNRLFAQHFTLRGAGNQRQSLAAQRRARLEAEGVFLPEISAADFLSHAAARPLTALHGCFYLALSRLPASFLPELIGVHYAIFALGVDDLLTGGPAAPPDPASPEPAPVDRALPEPALPEPALPEPALPEPALPEPALPEPALPEPALPEPELRAVLAAYLALAGPQDRRRVLAGLAAAAALEAEHVAMLAELARWHRQQPLESKVAAIVARHARYAGTQHQEVRVGGRLLREVFTDPGLDVAAFLAEFRDSPQLRGDGDGRCRFITAMKFGGPMFGIFSDREAATFRAWAATVQAGQRPQIVISPAAAGDTPAAELAAAIAAHTPDDVIIAGPGDPGDRELFYRLVNVESYPNTLPLARRRAEQLFTEAEVMFSRGAEGRYTDASWFDYAPEALYQRAERVYWDKLVQPYQPLTEIPDRDEVVFLQTTYALGALIDATWIHRTANLGRCQRRGDEALFTIYADEMGHGDLRKNHITLIHQALRSMGISLPHIREAAFMDQAELPDELYGFSLHQLCMAMFPDTFYNEILGYNLAIEMFGLGELRLHEIQKLRHYGFDDCYEQAHLTIDNLSAGHSRQAADIIVGYLDEVSATLGPAAVEREWRRVWRGYASLAWIVEHELRKEITAQAQAEPLDLLI